MTYFVAGVTGNVGGAAASKLLEQGCRVVTLARNPQGARCWTERGVEVRLGDLRDAAAVHAALAGVDGAFVLIPPLTTPQRGFPEAQAVINNYVAALQANPPGRLVALSSFGSQQTSGLGNITTTHMLEHALSPLGVPVAFVRAGSLLENYVEALDSAASTGVFYSFLQPVDRKVGMVATKDVGEEVAKLLTQSWTGVRTIEIGSYTSPNDLAAAMSSVVGRNVIAQAVPRARWAATLEQFGMPLGQTWAVEEIFDGINSGWIDFGQPNTEKVAGTTAPATVFANARRQRKMGSD